MRPNRFRPTRTIAVCATALLTTAACATGSVNGGGGSQAAGPSGSPVKGGTLNMLGAGDIDYMDPNVSYYSIGYLNLRMWSRQLFTNPAMEGRTTSTVPDLATELPTTSNGGISQDGKTYTIHLRKGVKWNTSPARQVTADDVVRGLKRTCNPVQPFAGTPDFQSLIEGYADFCSGFAKVGQTPEAIKKYVEGTPLPGVVAKDQLTVEFHLTHPASYFVDMLTMPCFSPAPEEVMQYAPGSQELAQHQFSDGPYQVESWKPTKQIVYTRNPAWTRASDPVRKAYVDKIVVNETLSEESVQQQLQTGSANADMEWDAFPPPSHLAQLVSSKDPLLNLGKTSSTNPYILFNNASPNNKGALSQLKVRQALEYAINRDHIIQVLGGPKINPPLTHVLPASIDGSKDYNLYPHDPGKAKQLLKQAGYSDGLKLKFLYRPSDEGERKAFQTVQQDLTDVGIKVTGVPSPDADFYTKYLEKPSVAKNGVWYLASAGWISDWYGNAALSYFNPLFSGKSSFPPVGSNFGFYNSAKANEIISQAAAAKTTQESSALWAKADHQVMEDAALFPITSPLQPNYRAQQVGNAIYVPSVQNFDPTNVWLSADAQGG